MPNVLGINLSSLLPSQVKAEFSSWLAGTGQHLVVTPNPEIILSSHHDEELFYILNHADLAPADGFGLLIAGWLYGEKIPRYPGADIVCDLLDIALEQGKRVAVLNWRGGLSRAVDIEASLRKEHGAGNHLVIDTSRTQSALALDLISKIEEFGPDILFCTFGSPFQEKALYHNLKNMPSVRLAIGCGGAFDFLTGRVSRAPRWLRAIGLEWLWRLLRQPSRWRRIYNATIVFIFRVIKTMTISRLRYRQNVACFLYKKEAGTTKVLVVERTGEPGHWQLPQGGTDGEEAAVAGARELREETGVVNLETRAVFKDLHRYDFPFRSRGEVSVSRRHKYDYKGQKQSLYIAEFLGDDKEININFWDHSAWGWIELDNLIAKLHPSRRESAAIFIDKFNSLKL